MFHVSEAPVAEYLSHEFKGTAKALLEKAATQNPGNIRDSIRYEKLIKSLRLVSATDAIAIFRSIWEWRKQILRTIGPSNETLTGQSRRVVVESVFLEACLQLLEDRNIVCTNILGQTTEDVERLAFAWSMKCEHYVTRQELVHQRHYICDVTQRLIGALAWGRLEAVSAIFFKELEARIQTEARQEIIMLCGAMERIRLTFFETPNDVAAAIHFVEHANPLKHKAPVKKSQVHHALASMLSSILRPHVYKAMPERKETREDQELMNKWFAVIDPIQSDILHWATKKSKHVNAGYPLLADLWCLEAYGKFIQNSDKVIKTMLKALKQKECRLLVMKILIQCTQVWLYRNRQGRGTEELLTKITKAVISAAKKGGFGAQELQDHTVLLCVTIGEFMPPFAVEHMILELIQYDNWGCISVGLRSLLELMLMAFRKHQRKTDSSSNVSMAPRALAELSSLERHELEPALLQYIATGHHTMELLNMKRAVVRLQGDLAKVLDSCLSLFGGMTLSTRSSAGDGTRDVVTGLNVFAWSLRLIPYLVPEKWEGSTLADSLSRFTSHSEAMVNSAAFRAMENILIGMPSLRNTVVEGMLKSVLIIHDDSIQAIIEGLSNIQDLLNDWQAIIMDPNASLTQSGPELNVHRLEGAALCFLCSTDPILRTYAKGILHGARELHKAIRQKQPVLAPRSSAGMKESPTQTWGGAQGPAIEVPTVYVMDVLEEMGSEIAQRCYWDIGEWSDLWRRWRQVPEGVTLTDLDGDQHITAVRWSRYLSEMAKEASHLCPQSIQEAYAFVSKKINRLMGRDSSGRLTLPLDAHERHTDLWRNYCAFACGCPPQKKSGSKNFEGPVSVTDLFRALRFPLWGSAPLSHQQSSILALAHCHPECYEALAKELKDLVHLRKDRSRQKIKVKLEEARMNAANILRIVADTMPKGLLKQDKPTLRKRFREFLSATVEHLQNGMPMSISGYIHQMQPDVLCDVPQLCHCLCIVAACAGPELMSAGIDGLPVELRKTLFYMFAQWCSVERPNEEYERLRTFAENRAKDTRVMDDLQRSVMHLEHAARLAMVAMLQGPLFDNDKRLSGPVFDWITNLLTAATPPSANQFGPSKMSIARQALLKMLVSNLFMFESYIEKCYHEKQEVATVYFEVVCEVYCSYEINCRVENLLSLVLYKCVDPQPEVREDALHLLRVLSQREWEGKATSGWSIYLDDEMDEDVVVMGSLEDSCQNFQYKLSESLARDHPEVNERLCIELLTRQLSTINRGVLVCLIPWMEQLSFSPGDGGWQDLLKSMYYVTNVTQQNSYEVEKLWSTVASNKRNIRPILDFLVNFGVKECALQGSENLLQYVSVLKRISLYVARASPYRTIDQLVSETSQMIQADDPLGIDEGDNKENIALIFSRLNSGSQGLDAAPSDFRRYPEPAGSVNRSRRQSRDGVAVSRHMASLSGVSDGSMGGGSQKSAMSEQFTMHHHHQLKRTASNMSGWGSEPRGSEVIDTAYKGSFQRSDLAVCLLAELAFEQGDKFSDNIPLLFHVCVICMDSPEPVIRLHCQQLIMNLLHAMISKQTGMKGRLGKISALMNSLKSMKGQPLWPYEDMDIRDGRVASAESVRFFVLTLLEVNMEEGSSLREQWTREALTWAVESKSRHLACRSLQVLRALCPEPSSELFINLMYCIWECFKNPTTASMECVLEIMCTMKVLMEKVEPTKIVLYPQLFWACMGLLSSDYVHVFRHATELLHLCLQCLNISNEIVVNVLLATTPGTTITSPVQSPASAPPVSSTMLDSWMLGTQALLDESDSKEYAILCLQQLLLRGFQHYESEAATVQILTLLARQMSQPVEHFTPLDSTGREGIMAPGTDDPIRSGISSLLGNVQVQIAVSLVGVVPWACLQISTGKYRIMLADVCSALGEACGTERWLGLQSALCDLGAAESHNVGQAMKKLAEAVCQEMPPKVQCLVLGYWLSLLQTPDPNYVRMALLLLHSFFKHSHALHQRGQAPRFMHVVTDSFAFSAISAHLQGPLKEEAQEVLSTMVACSSSSGSESAGTDANLTKAIRLGIELHRRPPVNPDQIRKTISGILQSCPQNSRDSNRREYMPFITEAGRL